MSPQNKNTNKHNERANLVEFMLGFLIVKSILHMLVALFSKGVGVSHFILALFLHCFCLASLVLDCTSPFFAQF